MINKWNTKSWQVHRTWEMPDACAIWKYSRVTPGWFCPKTERPGFVLRGWWQFCPCWSLLNFAISFDQIKVSSLVCSSQRSRIENGGWSNSLGFALHFTPFFCRFTGQYSKDMLKRGLCYMWTWDSLIVGHLAWAFYNEEELLFHVVPPRWRKKRKKSSLWKEK